jgi:hypothetical protein
MVERHRTHACECDGDRQLHQIQNLIPIPNRAREIRENAPLGDIWLLERGLH